MEGKTECEPQKKQSDLSYLEDKMISLMSTANQTVREIRLLHDRVLNRIINLQEQAEYLLRQHQAIKEIVSELKEVIGV